MMDIQLITTYATDNRRKKTNPEHIKKQVDKATEIPKDVLKLFEGMN